MVIFPNSKGFSLVELMITISILAIIVSMAAPSFNSSILNNRIDSTTKNLYTTLIFARSEAVKRNKKIHICQAKSDRSGCEANTTDWSAGWLVVLDDAILKIGEPASGIEVSGPNGQISYNGTGAAANYTLTIKGQDREKKLCIKPNGSIKEASSCI